MTRPLGRLEVRRRGRIDEAANAATARQWSADAVEVEAARRLKLVLEAAETTRYYRQRLPPEHAQLPPFTALERVPLLPRSDFRRGFARFLAEPRGRVQLRYSSGTGGERTQIVQPPSAELDREVAERRWYDGLGLPSSFTEVDVHPWPGVGSEARNRNDRGVSYVEFGARDVAIAFARDSSLGELLVAQPDVLRFLAGSTKWPGVRCVASSYEVLRPETKRELEEAGVPRLTDTYSMSELSPVVAFSHAGCRGMHVEADLVHVEVVGADDLALPPGRMGRIVVTDLANIAMPLLRYEVGDIGILEAAGACRCGRAFPLVRVLGRTLASFESTRQLVPSSVVIERLSGEIPGPFVLDRRAPGHFAVVTDASFDEERVHALLETLIGACELQRECADSQLARILRAGSFVVDTRTRYPLKRYLDGPAPEDWRPHPRFSQRPKLMPKRTHTQPAAPGLNRSAARRLLRTAYAQSGHESLVRVLDSGSMRPLLRREAMARVRWEAPHLEETKRGDIFLLEGPNGIPVVHRVAAVAAAIDGRPPTILQIGDAYKLGDPYAGDWVALGNVLGRVVSIEESDGLKLKLMAPSARRVGYVMALTARMVWLADRSHLRWFFGPLALLLQRGTASAGAAALRLGGRRRARRSAKL